MADPSRPDRAKAKPAPQGNHASEAEPPLHTLPHAEPKWEPKRGPPLLTRREFVRNTVLAAVGGALVAGTAAQLLPAIAPSAFGGGGAGPIIVRDPQTNAKTPVMLPDLAGPPPVQITAEYNYLPATIFKVKRSILEASARRRGYNTAEFALEMPGEPDNAIMVYEAKCKHLGCTVGWNPGLGGSKDVADYNEDGKNDGRILCPCHQGQYDIYDLANNVPGTPPPEPLNVVEFDVRSWTDEATGTTFPNVLFGVAKSVQGGPRAASGTSQLGLPANTFTIRQSGWFSG